MFTTHLFVCDQWIHILGILKCCQLSVRLLGDAHSWRSPAVSSDFIFQLIRHTVFILHWSLLTSSALFGLTFLLEFSVVLSTWSNSHIYLPNNHNFLLLLNSTKYMHIFINQAWGTPRALINWVRLSLNLRKVLSQSILQMKLNW